MMMFRNLELAMSTEVGVTTGRASTCSPGLIEDEATGARSIEFPVSPSCATRRVALERLGKVAGPTGRILPMWGIPP